MEAGVKFVVLLCLFFNRPSTSLSFDGMLVGSPCTLHAHCNNARKENTLLNSKCSDSKCACVNGYYGDIGSKTCQKGTGLIDNNTADIRQFDNTVCDDCRCPNGYIIYPAASNAELPKICAMVINSSIDPNCFWCDSTNGTCVDLDGDYLRDDCVCPVTRRSNGSNMDHPKYDCDISLFEVYCMSDSMSVCYSAPPRPLHKKRARQGVFDGYKIKVKDGADTSKCAFLQKADGAFCARFLLRPTLLGVCGVMRGLGEEGKEMYSTFVMVQSPDYGDQVASGRFTLKPYCEFERIRKSSEGGATIVSYKARAVSENDEFHPHLRLSVKNRQGNEISMAAPGDIEVQLAVDLLDFKDVYNSIMVDLCLAANSLTPLDNDTETVILISNGCALPGFSDFTHRPQEKRLMKTSLFTLPSLTDFDTVYILCSVRVCRQTGGCGANDCKKRRRSQSKPSVHDLTSGSFDWGVLSGVASSRIKILSPLPVSTTSKLKPFRKAATISRKGQPDMAVKLAKPGEPKADGIVYDSPDGSTDNKKACDGLFGSCHFNELHLILIAVGAVGFFVLLAALTFSIYRRKVNVLEDKVNDLSCALSSITSTPSSY